MYMTARESDQTIIQIPCDGKEVSADITGLPTYGDLVESDEGTVDAGNERPNVW